MTALKSLWQAIEINRLIEGRIRLIVRLERLLAYPGRFQAP